MLVNVAGTHNLKDVITDVNLAFGNLKNTSRYKEAKKVLEKAKKYIMMLMLLSQVIHLPVQLDQVLHQKKTNSTVLMVAIL